MFFVPLGELNPSFNFNFPIKFIIVFLTYVSTRYIYVVILDISIEKYREMSTWSIPFSPVGEKFHQDDKKFQWIKWIKYDKFRKSKSHVSSYIFFLNSFKKIASKEYHPAFYNF